MEGIRHALSGILVCLVIAGCAWSLGKAFPVVGGPVFGILLGMIIVMLYPKIFAYRGVEAGVKYSSKKLLQYAIILLGFEMNLFHVASVGAKSIFVIIFTLTAAFLIAFVVGKLLKLRGKMTTLIGVGTAICGGSAIAATAPVIRAKDQEVTHAISTIFLFNVIAVFVFPAFGHWLNMSDAGFGMWAGTAINDTSSVVAAGTSWSEAAGDNAALVYATIVKLTRTLMIVPIVLILALYMALDAKKKTGEVRGFEFTKVFPWFVAGFAITAFVNTFVNLPDGVAGVLVEISKFVIVMAMAGIGLNTNLKKLLTNGFKPILLGMCCWFGVAGMSLVVQYVLKMW